jgi:hypothetical protein
MSGVQEEILRHDDNYGTRSQKGEMPEVRGQES